MKTVKLLKKWTFFALSLIIIGCSSSTDPGDTGTLTQSQGDVGVDIGDVAPDFTLNTIDHGSISLADYEGKVIFLYFIGHNCGFCIDAGPQIESEINQRFKDREFQGIALDVWNGNETSLESFKTVTGLSIPLCLQAGDVGNLYEVQRDYAVVVDHLGKIRHRQFEPVKDLIPLISAIESLL